MAISPAKKPLKDFSQEEVEELENIIKQIMIKEKRPGGLLFSQDEITLWYRQITNSNV